MIFILIMILFFLLLLVGEERGSRSFAVLFFNTVIGIVCVWILGNGGNALAVMLVSCTLFSLITIFYQNGFERKTLATFLATTAVFLVISIAIYAICTNAHITGFNEIQEYEEGNEYLGSAVNLELLPIMIVSIVWGELGAIMDTSISISSVLNEIHLHNPQISSKQLIGSGMLVGKDILGTTINTLTFVALGESMILVLFYLNFNYSLAKLLNSKSFFQEVSGILFSCVGCVLIIPITAVIFNCLVKSERVNRFFEKHHKREVENSERRE